MVDTKVAATTLIEKVENTVEDVAGAIESLAKVDWISTAAAFKNGVSNPAGAIASAENVASAVVVAVSLVNPTAGAALAAADRVGTSFLNFLSKLIP